MFVYQEFFNFQVAKEYFMLDIVLSAGSGLLILSNWCKHPFIPPFLKEFYRWYPYYL
jgi:hypothetical protein